MYFTHPTHPLNFITPPSQSYVQDTGGFFVCVLQKVRELDAGFELPSAYRPSSSAAARSADPTAAVRTFAEGAVAAAEGAVAALIAGDASKVRRSSQVLKISKDMCVCVVCLSVSGVGALHAHLQRGMWQLRGARPLASCRGVAPSVYFHSVCRRPLAQ